MITFSNEDYLPGVVTEIESIYESDYDTSLFGTTDSVVVIGTAFDGPTNEIVPVYSITHAAYLFGKSYDPVTHREADLLAGITDAWNRGCRTIYAFRINGQEMYKDFRFATDTNYKLRIRSRYPSNLGKQVYMKFDNKPGAETITIYKPAVRATIKEKVNGMVESSSSVMMNKIQLGLDYALTKESKLVDVIEIVNGHTYNNVLEMAIVDENGNDVTTSQEVYDLTLGCLFPGVYFMGRGESACNKVTIVTNKLVIDEDDPKPFESFAGHSYQVLTFNSDVASDYPIYYESADINRMREVLLTANVTMKESDDYLEEQGVSERAFPDDSVDYEESKLTPFQIYQKLGEGFAVTAVAEQRKDGNGNEMLPKIKEAPLTDPLRVQPVGDGAYSILQDAKIKYRVLASGICADQEIVDKLPKAAKFKTTFVNNVALMNGLISAKPRVDEDNETAARSYKFAVKAYDLINDPIVINDDTLYRKGIAKDVGYSEDKEAVLAITNAKPGEIAVVVDGGIASLCIATNKGKFTDVVNKNYAGSYTEAGEIKYGGKLYAAGGHLYKADEVVADGQIPLTELTVADIDKDFILVESCGKLFVAKFDGEIQPICEFDTAIELSQDEDAEATLFVFEESNDIGENLIQIQGTDLASMNLNDFVEALNESSLSKLFTFELTSAGIVLRDEYVADNVDPADPSKIIAGADTQAKDDALQNGYVNAQSMIADGGTIVLAADRNRGYDYTKHIPYYTTDNFIRQLAQHCTYTELKTGPARGVIGFKRITDLSKKNLAKKVSELKSKNWDLYAKTYYGRNMLDNNNMPYPIGRNVSAVFAQNRVTTPSSYVQVCNGATAYAGMVSALPLEQSSTAQTIDFTPMFEFTHSQLTALTGAGIVSIRRSFTRGYIVTDGITMAPEDDVLKRLFNTRVMGYVEDLLRAACEPFIGKANNTANRNSLSTAIDSALSRITENRNANDGTALLLNYEFNLADDTTAEQYTYIDIYYTIRPVNEIRNIYNHIRVTR